MSSGKGLNGDFSGTYLTTKFNSMQQMFTMDHLVRYLYNETSASETLAISEALHDDWTLMEQYEELLATYQQLPKVKFSPTTASLKNILQYSRQRTFETQF